CNPQARLCRALQEGEHAAIVPVQCDQPAGIEGEAAQAAFPFLEAFFCPGGERTASAQARSFLVSGPPVCRRASSSISRHPAASDRATPTACFTKAETLATLPAAARSRISFS